MKIAVVGCAHGELRAMYNTVKSIEHIHKIKIDLLICCGDFQATRNESDLRCMAVPVKYYNMGSFYKYYSREETAPVLTIFIGGNHEASNYLQELEYGGWVAPNIYYMGYAGVINIGGIRIGGISGIYKGHDYMKGHFEKSPYDNKTKRSVYHVRNCEVFQLKQLKEPLDIMISHDWPRGVHKYGLVKNLLEKKPFFRNDINENKLGSQPCEELLFHLKPKYWFAAHLHTKFAALIPHDENENQVKYTKFLALDKCLPGRDFLQVIDIPHENDDFHLSYDLEWLTILYLTNHLISTQQYTQFMPGPSSEGRWVFTPTDEEKRIILNKFRDNLKIPLNFAPTAPIYDELNKSRSSSLMKRSFDQPNAQLNPQTSSLCDILGIENRIGSLMILDDDSSSSSCGAGGGMSSPSCNERSVNLSASSFIDDTVLVNDGSNNREDTGDDCDNSIDTQRLENENYLEPNSLLSAENSISAADNNDSIDISTGLDDLPSNSGRSKTNRSRLSLPSPIFESNANTLSCTNSDSPLILDAGNSVSISSPSSCNVTHSTNDDNVVETNDLSSSNSLKRNRSNRSLPSPELLSNLSPRTDSALESNSLSSASSPSCSVLKDVCCGESITNDDSVSENVQKKFKRRNQFIYDNSDL